MTTALFAALVDDAGLFPPAQLAMPAALARHRADDAAGHPTLTGRFLCPAARLPELLGHLAPSDRLRLALISPLDAGTLRQALRLVAADPRLELAGLEGPLAALPVPGPPGVPIHVEVPPGAGGIAALAAVARAGHAAKVRCGGMRAEVFPGAQALGAFVHECARLGLAFKATAGLHHAIRYHDERTGFTHHGFVNLLVATARAAAAAAPGEVVAALRTADTDGLVAEARALGDAEIAATRALFVAYGSCSTAEPAADLTALGLVPGTELAR